MQYVQLNCKLPLFVCTACILNPVHSIYLSLIELLQWFPFKFKCRGNQPAVRGPLLQAQVNLTQSKSSLEKKSKVVCSRLILQLKICMTNSRRYHVHLYLNSYEEDFEFRKYHFFFLQHKSASGFYRYITCGKVTIFRQQSRVLVYRKSIQLN